MQQPKEERYTLADAMTWNEDERTELIGGLPVMMAPPSRTHQKIVGELFAQIHGYLEGKRCEAYVAPFAVRPFEEDGDRPENVDTMMEPDITVVCDPKKLDDIGCKGAPDFIAEVLSPSSKRHDRLVKFELYQRAGVPEYWIVDPELRTVQACVLDGDSYRVAALYTERDIAKVRSLEGCYVDMSKVFE